MTDREQTRRDAERLKELAAPLVGVVPWPVVAELTGDDDGWWANDERAAEYIAALAPRVVYDLIVALLTEREVTR